MVRTAILCAASAILLAGCASHRPRPTAIVEQVQPVPVPTGWRALATPLDQQRLALIPWLWPRALGSVPRRMRAQVAAEGALLKPAALDLPAPPPGPYRCRLLRIGGRPGFQAFAPDFCYVDGDNEKLSFTKTTGTNLPGGWLHVDTDQRLVFLGAVPKAGSKDVPLYGTHPQQDVAGFVERVSPLRWRLVLTRPRRGAMMEVYELVPVPPEVPGAKPAAAAKI